MCHIHLIEFTWQRKKQEMKYGDITWKNSKKIGKLKQQVKEYILSDFMYIKLSK
jgi:hypothetical protein